MCDCVVAMAEAIGREYLAFDFGDAQQPTSPDI